MDIHALLLPADGAYEVWRGARGICPVARDAVLEGRDGVDRNRQLAHWVVWLAILDLFGARTTIMIRFRHPRDAARLRQWQRWLHKLSSREAG